MGKRLRRGVFNNKLKQDLEKVEQELDNYKKKAEHEKKLLSMYERRLELMKKRNEIMLKNFMIKEEEKKWDYEKDPEYWSVIKELQKIAFESEEYQLITNINNVKEGLANTEQQIRIYEEVKIPEIKNKMSEMGEKDE